MNQTEQFFRDIFGNEHINFRCISLYNRPVDTNGFYNNNMEKLLKQTNEQNYEIYFVVNIGGYRDEQIKKINSVFIDLDCGRNEKNDYFPLLDVEKYKKKKLKELNKFIYRPSYIVQTRKGLHVYWLVNSDSTIEQFNECEERLIQYFDADTRVKNPARLMRVPGFYWCKDINNKFMAQIIQRNEERYSIQDIIESLPEIIELLPEIKKQKTATGDFGQTINSNISTYCVAKNPPDDNLLFIKEQNIAKLHELLNPEPSDFTSHEEVYNYLKCQDLNQYLGVYGNSFNCIFHDDRKPSAGIIINENGHQVYNCQSSNCGFKGTIIDITESLTGLNRVQALRFLRKVYKIEYVQTEWQLEQQEILEENQRFIISEDFKEFYPDVYKRIKNYLGELYLINGFAKEKIVTEKFADTLNNAVFFVSIRHLANICGKDINTIATRIGLFVYLGLIFKLNKQEIPEFLYEQARKQAGMKKQKYLIGFYSIPSYGFNTLSFSKQKAEEFIEKGFTIKGWSREMILNCLGEEEANRIFPQMKDKPIPELNRAIAMKIEKITLELIEEKGWTTEYEISGRINLYFKGQKKFKERQIKKAMPEILDKYCLERNRLNNKLKQELGIISLTGYPFIIYTTLKNQIL